jgi:hypothetical protein
MRGFLIALALAGLLTGCAHTPREDAVAPSPVLNAPGAPVDYRVTALVLHLGRSGETLACYAILQSLPPAGCSGVRVTGVSRRTVAGTRKLPNADWQTPVVEIVGVWKRGVLHVLRTTPTTGRTSAPAPPAACSVPATRAARALQRSLTRLAPRIHLLETGPCGSRVWALVADPATRAAIYQRYGRRVLIRSWLRPAA